MSDLKVMKGSAYSEKRLRKWLKEDGAVVIQTKRDEFRCMVEIDWSNKAKPVVSYTSAQGKPLYNLSQFDSLWAAASHFYGTNVFDTGVCVNDSFELTRRTLRASKKVYDLRGGSKHHILDKKKGKVLFEYYGELQAHFWLYDLPLIELDYTSRRMDMAKLALNFPEFLRIPESELVIVDDLATPEHGIDMAVVDVERAFEHALLASHEGLMVKRANHKWEPRRCNDSWMKMKPSEEIDGVIVGWNPAKEGKFFGLIGSLQCRAEDGSEFNVSGMTDAERADFTENFEQYRGQWLTATYMNRDAQGGYRHVQFNRMHDEKNL